MSHFTPRYSAEQTQAIVDAVLKRGLSAPAACRAAESGELGLPPFQYNVHTAYAKVARAERHEQRQQAAKEDPRAALAEMAKSMVAVLREEVEKLANLQGKGRLDADRFTKWVKAAKELEALTRALHVPEAPNTTTPLLENLLNEARQHETAGV